MNCSEFDIKGYFLNELAAAERTAAERHVRSCGACSEELDRLRITESALLALPEEEMPRRLVFAAERAPEPQLSWWQRFWNSGPKLGFASAAMLSCAILVHGVTRPVPAVPAAQTPVVDAAAIEARLNQSFEAKLAAGIAEAGKRADQRAAQMVAANEQKLANEYRAEVVSLASQVEWLTKKMNVMRVAANYEVRQ